MNKIKLEMNNPKFQESLFGLNNQEQRSLLNTLKKISKLSWEGLYKDHGLKWELISQKSKKGNSLYSFRFSQKYRGTAYREEDYMVLVGLFPDHDSAYK